MRLHTGIVTAITDIRSGVVLLDMYAPELARTVQPGQFCMVRCTPPSMTDPLLRRPYFIHSIKRERGICSLLVHVQGRGSAWLANQREGAELDLLGPLGHGWHIRQTTRNLLLLTEECGLSAMTQLIQHALELELAITLINIAPSLEASYPPALLPPEVEYHVITDAMQLPSIESNASTSHEGNRKRRKKKSARQTESESPLITLLADLLPWADAICCNVSHETLRTLSHRFDGFHERHFAQAVFAQPLVCGTGICFACSIDTISGQRLVCKDGPVFDVRELS